ncbi:TonB-dependent receptor family protein [Zhongshania aliphaticivorans]|uniref:TonB-dependent receptor family protein n=1 Tax=Zhongshania aliphaticivorans TaxID=1470434 RepID=UPI0012E69A7D|nr:TonB-dependent receptor [Zhongshania aliphaticivorans]CAA0106751.1 Ferripyoverdine receptor [Zhongshania aliphaticivorans]
MKQLPFVYMTGLLAVLPVGAFADHAAKQMEEMLVQGQELKSTLQAEQVLTPGGVSILDSASLMERNTANLSDALRYIPGVWSMSTSGSDSIFFSSRGSNLDATNYDMNGIKLLQDGLPVTTADGNNHNRVIDPLASRYATIARGANALKYGASTLGGAIDFVTPTARNTEKNEFFVGAGSFGQQQLRLTLSSVLSESLDGLVTVEKKQRDGYRDHNESEREGVYANLGWQLSDNIESRFFFTYIANDEELAGALTEAELAADPDQAGATAESGNFQVDVDTRRFANKTTFTLSESSSIEVGVYQENQHLYHPIVDKVLVDFDGDGPDAPVEVFSLLIDTDHQDRGAMLRYKHSMGEHAILAGINWGENKVEGGNYRNDGGFRNGLTTVVDNSAESLEIFVMDRWQFSERWTLVYGVQSISTARDVRNTTVSSGALRNPSADYDSINPRAGVIYQLSDSIDVFANVSKLYEAPTNFELEDEASATSATLSPMQGQVFEVGSRGRYEFTSGGFWRWDVSLYYALIQDEILSQDDPSAPGTSLTSNVDDTIHAGIEALIDASFAVSHTARIEPLLSITFNEFSFDGDASYGDNSFPAAPSYVVHGEIVYRHDNGFYAGPTFDIVDERYADFSNSYTIDGYNLLGFRLGLNREAWQVYLDIRNITGEDYVSVHSVVDTVAANSAIFNAGEPRSAYAGFVFRF